MTIEVSQAEHDALVEVLEERLRSLRIEIQHTDRRAYKAMLLAREQLLQKLCENLTVPTAA